MGFSSDGKECGSDGKEECKDGGNDGTGLFSAELNFIFDENTKLEEIYQLDS